jgi:lipopolysaccharide export system protein LptA
MKFLINCMPQGGMALMVSLALLAGAPALAQTFGGAFDGMSNSDEPIQIEADRLEVADKDGTAVFSGNVAVTQGSTLMRTKNLKVLYARDSQGKAGPGGNVKKIEASGGVAVQSNDQVASADKAIVDMDSQIASLSGNVSVSQGNNIITGCLITINMKTNNIDVKPCGNTGGSGRVKVLIDRATGTKPAAKQ